MKITLISLFVEDPASAFTFYTETLGFVKRMYLPEYGLAIVASPEEPDGTGLLLEPRGDSFGKTYQIALFEAGLPAIVFGVQDIQSEYERLRKRGVKFRKEPTKTDWGTEAICDDTCGNWIQMAQNS